MTEEPRPRPRRAIRAVAFGIALSVCAACSVEVVNLGDDGPRPATHDAGTPTTTTSGCPDVTEAEAQALAGTSCASVCAEGAGAARSVGSAAELFAVIAGRWQTCGGDVPWASSVVGVEFQNGCTLFLLHASPDGGTVRGVDPSDQGTFNIVEATTGTRVARSLELFFPSLTWSVDVTTSDCPHHMELRPRGGDAGAPDGGAVELTAISSTTPPLQ
jgi:hypothetical protein